MMNVYVDEVDTTFARALEHDGTSLRKSTDRSYGNRTGGVLSEGNQWWISTRIEDVSEEETRRLMAETSG